jgi:hypothetical protein
MCQLVVVGLDPKENDMLLRQGDILIQKVEEIPAGAQALKRLILAAGSATGHRHRIKERKSARAYAVVSPEKQELFLEVTADEATLVHPEHDSIALAKGVYRIWRQREHTEWGNRYVID